MSILSKLATSLNRRDEVPNQELAKEIILKKNKASVTELFENLQNRNKNIQSDCIKVIYEIAEEEPALIIEHFEDLIKTISHKNNRLQWGAMHALNAITDMVPDKIYNSLGAIILTADKGTVITNDHCVAILAKLAKVKKYTDDVTPLIFERLNISPLNQFPMYAEYAFPVISEKYKGQFIQILQTRLKNIEPESKRKRIEKLIKKVRK